MLHLIIYASAHLMINPFILSLRGVQHIVFKSSSTESSNVSGTLV